jgi:hypothetical protein
VTENRALLQRLLVMNIECENPRMTSSAIAEMVLSPSPDCALSVTLDPIKRRRRARSKLHDSPSQSLDRTDTAEEQEIHLARIVKFGIPGSDMPGHEYLSDQDASSLALWLIQA